MKGKMKLLQLNYKDRSYENRIENTIKYICKEDLEIIAEYIVQLEMRLESLGNYIHYS